MAESQKWTNNGAGPVQVSRFNKALRALLFLKGAIVELSGVHGKPETERRYGAVQLFGSTGYALPMERHAEIGERFGWTLTKENAKDATAAYEAATRECSDQSKWPVKDERRTQEQEEAARVAVSRFDAQEKERAAAALRSFQAIAAKRPAWASALIVAELHQDQCDPMSDYFHSKVIRYVAIGWRRGAREDFRQLRQAAATFPETVELATGDAEKVEHRDNYSMGAGNWLGERRYAGWHVRSASVGTNEFSGVYESIEDHLPGSSATQADTPGEPTHGEGFTITDRTHTKKGMNYSQVELSSRVDREWFNALRDSCKSAGGWYSREWSNIPGGFAFDSRDKAENWARATFKKSDGLTDDDVRALADDHQSARAETEGAEAHGVEC